MKSVFSPLTLLSGRSAAVLLLSLGAVIACSPAEGDGTVDDSSTTGGASVGGSVVGAGGNIIGAGGTVVGAGGTVVGAGGTVIGAGGTVVGAGGTVVGAGGTVVGAGGGGGTPVECGITVTPATNATNMPVVQVVEFSTDLAGATEAYIDFGYDTSYGYTAPVDMADPTHRTLLVGVTPNTDYHYRVTVKAGAETCSSPDMTGKTGALPNGISGPTVSSGGDSAKVQKGFRVVATGNNAVIINEKAQVVWGFNFGGQVFSAELSWSGKSMIARDLGPFDGGSGGNIWTVPLDGAGGKKTTQATGGHHHDIAAFPGGIAYLAKSQQGQYDKIFTMKEDGTGAAAWFDLTPVFSPFSAGVNDRHANYISYDPEGNFFTVSDREKDAVVKISAEGSGSLIKSIGKAADNGTAQNHIVADVKNWRVQHGHHWYDDNHFLVFSNGDFGGGTSHVIHFTINGNSATEDWNYTAMGNSGTQGNVTMMPNGTIHITSSNSGNVHELDETRTAIQTLKFGSLGYVHWRASLYGPPVGP